MNVSEEIGKIISYKEQVLNRYSDRAQIAIKYEIKNLKKILCEIKSYERKIKHYEKYVEDLKKYNGDLFFENNKLKEEVEHGRFYELEREMSQSALKMVCENILLIKSLMAENEELKIHIRSLLYEGKQYENIGG